MVRQDVMVMGLIALALCGCKDDGATADAAVPDAQPGADMNADQPLLDRSNMEPVPQKCGDTVISGTEQCDGALFGGKTCLDLGFDGGTLLCNKTSCTFDTSGCYRCGDGKKNVAEQCDGSDLDSKTCKVKGFDGGTLKCLVSCTFDMSGCYRCGDGKVNGTEICDGAQLGASTCKSLKFDGGTLRCKSDCTGLDSAGCFKCGDSKVNGNEKCDGGALNGKTCADLGLGFKYGTLKCSSTCDFDTSGCHTCGDGTVDSKEDCDGSNLNGKSCKTCCTTPLFDDGTLKCKSTCTFDTSGCYKCGNGQIDLTKEECDGSNLGSHSCQTRLYDATQYYDGGALSCKSCKFSTSGCYKLLDKTQILLSADVNDKTYPAVASDGSGFLVAWMDTRNQLLTAVDIYGAQVSKQGKIASSADIAITKENYHQGDPAMAFDGTNYLAVWSDYRVSKTNSPDIHGARVSKAGQVLDTSGFSIAMAIKNQTVPAVAFDGTNYLVVWQDSRNKTKGNDIYGARVSTSGKSLDTTGIVISADTTSDRQHPTVACGTGGCLVVWQDSRSGNWDVYGARVDSSGKVQETSGLAFAKGSFNQQRPAVASDGTDFLVVWHDDSEKGTYRNDIYGARVDKSGKLLDSPAIAISKALHFQEYPAVAHDGTNYLVVWSDRRTGVEYFIYGARVDPGGKVLDPSGIPISTAIELKVTTVGYIQQYPRVACGTSSGPPTCMVVWQYKTSYAKEKIYGARFVPRGSP